jgi:hypothetical protein
LDQAPFSGTAQISQGEDMLITTMIEGADVPVVNIAGVSAGGLNDADFLSS